MSIIKDLSFVAIDIETTGLDYRNDEIIEIAAIRFQDGVETARFDTFVRPHGKLPKFIEYLTHISPDDLKQAPQVGIALSRFREFISGAILVGHNISFDLGFINHYLTLGKDIPLSNHSYDTADLSRYYLPYLNDHKLSTLTEFFDVSLENAHRADADAKATGELLIHLTNYAVENISLSLNSQLLALARQANLDNSNDRYLDMICSYQRKNALLGTKTNKIVNEINNLIISNGEGAVGNKIHASAQMSMQQIFGEDGLFAQAFEQFEYRAGQLDMAFRVIEALKEKNYLVVEAGTGVGKSFAYLVPALIFAHREKKKTIVSTNTKNLQEQLFHKDLPLLKDILPVPFKAVLVKGRDNYICQRRWEDMIHESGRGISPYEAQAMMYLKVWYSQTNTGDVSENSSFDSGRHRILWRKICSDRFNCLGRNCKHASICFVMRLRKEIEKASLCVTNHSLLLADLQMEHTTLGEYDYLIIDEAHNLMASAGRHFGFELGYADTIHLFNQLASSAKRKHTGYLAQLLSTLSKSLVSDAEKEHIAMLCNKLESTVEELRSPVTKLFNYASAECEAAESYGKLRIKEMHQHPVIVDLTTQILGLWKGLCKDLWALQNVFNGLNSQLVPNYEVIVDTIKGYVNRAAETEGMFISFANPDLDNYALWIENQQKTDRNIPAASFCYAPVEVNTHLNNLLYKSVPCVVFTSATLSIRESFKYFNHQSGLDLLEEKVLVEAIVESPFNYTTQAKLLISSYLPEHKDRFFMPQVLSVIYSLIEATNIGTMLLFTSYKDLNAVYDHLGDLLYHKKRPFFAQGKGGSRSSILKEFRKSNNGVLLGTNSFWEGVDIQGDSLSLLILFKLPFQPPSEPLIEALIEKLDRENRDSFMHFMLPNALLKLRQGFGRLIRSKTDRGIVLILDSRVSKKRYGEFFKMVLPARCIETQNEHQLITEIAGFFAPGQANRTDD